MLHGTTWNSKIYAGSWKVNSASVEDAARSLQGIFATDPEYAAKLIQIIKEYNLTQYDDIENLSEEFKNLDAPASPLLEAMPSDLKFPEYDGNNTQAPQAMPGEIVHNMCITVSSNWEEKLANSWVMVAFGVQAAPHKVTIQQLFHKWAMR